LRDTTLDSSQLQVTHQTAQDVAGSIVQQLQGLGFTANQVARGQQVSGDNILIVDGEFTDISQGNRLQRMVIGLGLGQSVLDADVLVNQTANGINQEINGFRHSRR